MDELISAICNVATTISSVPMLSRTHGQPASPTTLGKEMAIFAYRLSRERRDISPIEILGKFACAVGNYNAHLAAYPEIKWPQIAEELVISLGLKFNPYVSQVNEAALAEDLNNSWEVLAEPIQTVMRRYGLPEPYEKLKELTRGRAVTKESIREFIEKLDIPIEAKTSLLNLTPYTYIGAAADLAKNINKAINMVNRKVNFFDLLRMSIEAYE